MVVVAAAAAMAAVVADTVVVPPLLLRRRLRLAPQLLHTVLTGECRQLQLQGISERL